MLRIERRFHNSPAPVDKTPEIWPRAKLKSNLLDLVDGISFPLSALAHTQFHERSATEAQRTRPRKNGASVPELPSFGIGYTRSHNGYNGPFYEVTIKFLVAITQF